VYVYVYAHTHTHTTHSTAQTDRQTDRHKGHTARSCRECSMCVCVCVLCVVSYIHYGHTEVCVCVCSCVVRVCACIIYTLWAHRMFMPRARLCFLPDRNSQNVSALVQLTVCRHCTSYFSEFVPLMWSSLTQILKSQYPGTFCM
jgi:hypothetical protein